MKDSYLNHQPPWVQKIGLKQKDNRKGAYQLQRKLIEKIKTSCMIVEGKNFQELTIVSMWD